LTAPQPNPFGGITRFSVNLPRAAQVDIAVHDVAGRRIATLAHGVQEAGRKSYPWGGSSQRSGLYFIPPAGQGRLPPTPPAPRRAGGGGAVADLPGTRGGGGGGARPRVTVGPAIMAGPT